MSYWDTTACFKALCAAYSDFQKQPTDQTVQDLQRQIDVLLGVTTHGASLENLSLKNLLYAESLSALVSVINEPNLKNPIYLKSITALSQLANDVDTKNALQTTFNLVPSLVGFILRLQATSSKQLSIMTLQLMEKLTYRHKLTQYSQLPELLRFLLKKICSSSSDQSLYCLGIVANLCHKNATVQSFIKSMDDAKNLYKTLFNFLSHSKKSYSITSLSILTSLVLEEETGEKVFSGNNLINIIHLVFKTLISTEEYSTKQYCIDLIIDLLNCEKTYKVISESNQLFSTYLQRILLMFHSTDPSSVTKIFELLNALCSKELTRKKLTQLFVKQNQLDDETQLPDENIACPGRALLHWTSQVSQKDSVTQTSILAMRFTRDMLKECIVSGLVQQMNHYVKEVLPLCMEKLLTVSKLEEEKLIRRHCEKTVAALEILIGLCKNETTKQALLLSFDDQLLSNIINDAYCNYSDDIRQMRSPIHDCSDEVTSMVFRSLELFATLKHDLPTGTTKYSGLLQNVHLIPFLSHGIKSKSKYLVHSSLQIILEAIKNKEFQLKSLGDNIVSINSSHHADLSMLKSGHPTPPVNTTPHIYAPPIQPQPFKDITNMKCATPANITALTEKLRKGLDIKDSKISDIMDYYEHKIAAMASRENHLQDVIDAKTSALAQSDRLLTQNRCRQAQSDAECLKLRTLLQDSERRCETDSVRMDEFLKTKSTLEDQISKLNIQLKQLETVASEHQQLLIKHREQTHKLDAVQKSLEASEEDNHSLSAMNDCLHKNSEKLKSKLECSNDRLKLIENELQNLKNHLTEKDNSINSLNEYIKQAENKYQEKQKEIAQLEKQKKEQDKKIKLAEKSLQDTRHKVSTLEVVCQQHEDTIKLKEESIQQLQDEVEKHAQITAMINNLTSGKMNPTK